MKLVSLNDPTILATYAFFAVISFVFVFSLLYAFRTSSSPVPRTRTRCVLPPPTPRGLLQFSSVSCLVCLCVFWNSSCPLYSPFSVDLIQPLLFVTTTTPDWHIVTTLFTIQICYIVLCLSPTTACDLSIYACDPKHV